MLEKCGPLWKHNRLKIPDFARQTSTNESVSSFSKLSICFVDCFVCQLGSCWEGSTFPASAQSRIIKIERKNAYIVYTAYNAYMQKMLTLFTLLKLLTLLSLLTLIILNTQLTLLLLLTLLTLITLHALVTQFRSKHCQMHNWPKGLSALTQSIS